MNSMRFLLFLPLLILPLAAQEAELPPPRREILWCDPATGDHVGCDRITSRRRAGENWEQAESCVVFWSMGGKRGERLSPHWSVRFAGPLPGRERFVFVHKQGVELIHAASGKHESLWPFDEHGALLFGWAEQDPFGRRLFVPGMSFKRLEGQVNSGCFLGVYDFRDGSRRVLPVSGFPTGIVARERDLLIAAGSRTERLEIGEKGETKSEAVASIIPGWTLLGRFRKQEVYLGENHQSLIWNGERHPLGHKAEGRFLAGPGGVFEVESRRLREFDPEDGMIERLKLEKGEILGSGAVPGGAGIWIFTSESEGMRFVSGGSALRFGLELPAPRRPEGASKR